MKRIVFGATGLLGSAFMRKYPDAIPLSTKDFDMSNQSESQKWFEKNALLFNEPITSYLCMGNVSGITGQKNMIMLMDNALMSLNILSYLKKYQKQGKIVYFGSSCIYPSNKKNKLQISDLLNGPLEQSNEGYALGKMMGVKFCEYSNDNRFLAVIPPNLVGINDNWNPENCHVFPAMIRKIIDARRNKLDKVTFMGNNNVRREFLHTDDLVDGVDFYLSKTRNDKNVINIGFGFDLTLGTLATLIAQRVKYYGILEFGGNNVGTYQKLLDNSLMISLGWKPKNDINVMIDLMIQEYEHDNYRQKNLFS